jgi:hypothetical protein
MRYTSGTLVAMNIPMTPPIPPSLPDPEPEPEITDPDPDPGQPEVPDPDRTADTPETIPGNE